MGGQEAQTVMIKKGLGQGLPLTTFSSDSSIPACHTP